MPHVHQQAVKSSIPPPQWHMPGETHHLRGLTKKPVSVHRVSDDFILRFSVFGILKRRERFQKTTTNPVDHTEDNAPAIPLLIAIIGSIIIVRISLGEIDHLELSPTH
jgi:hypothetical protein